MKLSTNIYHVSGHCSKYFQGHRSKVKVTARPNALLRRRHAFGWRGVEEAHLFILKTDCIFDRKHRRCKYSSW